MKIKKLLIPLILLLLIALAIFFIFSNTFTKNKNIKVASLYIPEEDKIYLDTNALSLLTNHLLYKPILKQTKDGYSTDLAESYQVKNSEILVTFKDEDTAKLVYDSYLELGKEIYENSIYLSNIIGFDEYQNNDSQDISGMIQEGNSLTFKVIDTNNLLFLTVPIKNYKSDFYVKEITNNKLIITNDKTTYEIEKVSKEDAKNKKYDLFMTSNFDLENNNLKSFVLNANLDYLILQNFSDDEYNNIKNALEGKEDANNQTITMWVDSSVSGVQVTDKLKENNIELNLDYGQYDYLMSLIGNDEKIVIYYENDYIDINQISKFNNIKLLQVPTNKYLIQYSNNFDFNEFF